MKCNFNSKSSIACLGIIISLISTNYANSADDCSHSPDKLKCLEFVKISDGDTAIFNIPNTHPLLGNKVRISLSDVKVPTSSIKNKCAKDIRKKSKKLSKSLLKAAKYIEVTNAQKYRGGIIGEIHFDNKKLSQHLVKSKLAVNKADYKQTDWCQL